MLNPSTADHSVDDPTIRKCIKFASREACSSLTVVNLYGMRSTDPDELLAHNDPHGADNYWHIVNEINRHRGGLIICAWGSHKSVRASNIASEVFRIIKDTTIPMCLKVNKDGNPSHPLYVPDNQPLVEFNFGKCPRSEE
jgi:hypothetical protein